MGYGKWTFADCTVREIDWDGELHAFNVFDLDGEYLGQITPADAKATEGCRDALDEGSSPIADGWEDGYGNCCTLSGWGEE